MRTPFSEEKFKEKEKKLKKVSNNFLYTFIVVFLVGYAFFFTSSLWLPKTYTGVNVTPIGSSIKANNRIITVDRWVYSPNDKRMEIIVEIEDNSIDGLKDYTWQLRDKNGYIKTEVVAHDDNIFVVHGKNIKKGWAEVSLTLDVISLDGEKAFTPVVVYMDDKTAPVVEALEEKSLDDYRVLAYESRIDGYSSVIASLNEDIASKQVEITQIDNRIEELVKRLEYQTDTEKDETGTLITSLEQQKNNLLGEIDRANGEITELEKKIEITKTILNELIDGGVE